MAVVSSPARRSTKRHRRARPGSAFERLVRIMHTLRAPGGCPWDRKQTHETLRSYLLEETYEALDAIDRDDPAALEGELGDVLLQIVFHAEIASADRRFDIVDVIEHLTAKLIRRHPHVFSPGGRPLPRGGAPKLKTPRKVVEQWEALKAREQRAEGQAPGVLAGVPRALPALLRAHKIGSRVSTIGFDWPNADAVVDKIEEEVRELRSALREGRARTADELGDVLFTLANLARHLGIEPESALRQANDKFTRRFAAVEAAVRARGREVHQTPPDELETTWNAVKHGPATRASSRSARSRRGSTPRARRSRE